VVNSTASAKAVKVRFLEGKNSKEVLDFNLYLSAKDVWVAAIIPTATGAGIYTPDKSCTTPVVSADATNPTPFVNYAYTGSSADGADTSLDRTREGYVEIIEMGNILAGTTTETAVTHVAGVPPCTASALAASSASAATVAGNGGLFGGMTIINVLAGEDFAVDATALEGFSTTALWFAPGSVDPQLGRVNPKTSVVTAGAKTYVTDWLPTTATPVAGTCVGCEAVDPVSAVMMHNSVYNEFVLETVTKSRTDWVATMPTKRFYIATGSGNNAGRLFQRNFNGNSGSCDDVVVAIYDREERTVTTPGSFSPPPPTQTDAICWEANIITFNNTNVFGSKNVANIPTTFQAGWLAVNFPVVNSTRHQLVGGASTLFNTSTVTPGLTATATTQASTTFNGLPVIGFSAITFENGVIPNGGGLIQSQYGGSFSHKQTRSIQ
jgi:hypothetical protein